MQSMEVKDQWVDTKAGRLFVRSWISDCFKGKNPIILFHDSLGCVELWRDFPVALSSVTERNVIAYDRLGYGRSDAREAALTMDFIAEEAENSFLPMVKQLGLKKAVLFGHSVGGGMALVCASHFAEPCEAVITESAQSFVENCTLEGIILAKKNHIEANQIERLSKYHGKKARWVFDSWTETWLDPRFASWSLREDLPGVKCPVLGIHGDRDEFGSIAHLQLIEKLTGGVSEVKILSNCGHVPHREQRDVVLRVVKDFLKR